MNIGITIQINEANESVWSNGIKQNAIYLLKLLKLLGHDVCLVNAGKLQGSYENNVPWDINEIPVKDFNKTYKDLDVLFLVGATYSDDDMLVFKESGINKKVIRYACGNNYVMDMESCMFDRKLKNTPIKTNYNQIIDEVWFIPQHENTNSEYFRVLHNLDKDSVKVVPFIWDPMFLDIEAAKFNNPNIINDLNNKEEIKIPIYIPGKPNIKKNIVCFEPNMNVVKWSMVPYLIVEDYNNNGGAFKKFTILSGTDLIKNDYYVSVVKYTSIFNANPVKIEYLPRVQTVSALANIADIVIAHQWENSLNYAYLDALYLQYPLVHNSPMLQDAGYYYPEFNIEEGKNQLELAMDKHDKHIDKYNAKSEQVLTRYTIYNEEMVALYGKLLDNLVTPGTHELSHRYDWKTNTYL